MENWQLEYLQFTLYIFATIWLLQKGSKGSKKSDRVGRESDQRQLLGEHTEPDSPRWARTGGWRTAVFSNSVLLVMTAIWIASWLAQSLTERIVYNADQLDHQAAAVSWPTYVTTSDFWNRTLQNWQSEFLAIASMAILSVFLRQRGSPESKARRSTARRDSEQRVGSYTSATDAYDQRMGAGSGTQSRQWPTRHEALTIRESRA
jgi:membrane protein implicated in regulation of membrane protease activity